MTEVCADNRFEIIADYRRRLIEETNIEAKPEEMAVLDSILFRFWQMGWLAEQEPVKPIEFHNSFRNGSRIDCFCGNCTTQVGMLFSNQDTWRFHYHFCPRCGRKVKWDG